MSSITSWYKIFGLTLKCLIGSPSSQYEYYNKWYAWQPLQDFKNSDLKMAILVLKTAPNHQNSDQKSKSDHFGQMVRIGPMVRVRITMVTMDELKHWTLNLEIYVSGVVQPTSPQVLFF